MTFCSPLAAARQLLEPGKAASQQGSQAARPANRPSTQQLAPRRALLPLPGWPRRLPGPWASKHLSDLRLSLAPSRSFSITALARSLSLSLLFSSPHKHALQCSPHFSRLQHFWVPAVTGASLLSARKAYDEVELIPPELADEEPPCFRTGGIGRSKCGRGQGLRREAEQKGESRGRARIMGESTPVGREGSESRSQELGRLPRRCGASRSSGLPRPPPRARWMHDPGHGLAERTCASMLVLGCRLWSRLRPRQHEHATKTCDEVISSIQVLLKSTLPKQRCIFFHPMRILLPGQFPARQGWGQRSNDAV